MTDENKDGLFFFLLGVAITFLLLMFIYKVSMTVRTNYGRMKFKGKTYRIVLYDTLEMPPQKEPNTVN